MIGEEITRAGSGRLSKLFIYPDAVEIFRQRPCIVVDKDIIAVADELRVLFPSDNEPLDSAAECIVLVTNGLLSGGALSKTVFGIPRISPVVRAFALLRRVAIRVEAIGPSRGRN